MMWYSQSSVALSSRVTQRQCGISDGSWALTEGTASLPSYGDQFSSKNKKRGPLSKTYLLLVCLHWKNGSYVARNDWTQCREISSKKALSKKPSSFPSFQLGPKLWAAFHSLIVEVGIKDCESWALVSEKQLCGVHEAAPKCTSWALWRETPPKRDEAVVCAHSHTHTNAWLLVVGVVCLNNKLPHRSGLLPGSSPQEKHSGISLSKWDFETSLSDLCWILIVKSSLENPWPSLS